MQLKAEKKADLKGMQAYNQAERAQDLDKTLGVTSTETIIGTDAAARAEFRQKINEANWTNHGSKHVKARTNEEAQRFSRTGGEEAQYLPELKGKIEEVEREAIWKAIDRGMVKQKDGKYFFFHKFEQPIGYNNGKLTQWIRVEVSNVDAKGKSQIHGHPTNLETVRKDFPNVKE